MLNSPTPSRLCSKQRTGLQNRRAETTSIDLDHVNIQRHTVLIIQKGNQQRHCQISREGMQAIQDYIEKERALDAGEWKSPALFLPASTVPKSSGRLTPVRPPQAPQARW